MNRYAGVVLPLGVDKVFTYLIPPELEEFAVAGVRVVVPFGRKIATGMIVDLPSSSDVPGLKPIRDVIDPAPVLRGELPALCRWIADYYLAPLGEVVKTALPQGFSPASTRYARSASPLETTSLTPSRKKLLDILLSAGPTPVRELGRRSGIRSVNAVLNDLERTGHVVLEESFRQPRKHSRPKNFVMVDRIDRKSLTAAIQVLSSRARKARALLETVQRLYDSGTNIITTADLVKQSGSSTSILRRYRESGLLPIEQRDIGFAQNLGTEEQTRTIKLNSAQRSVLEAVTEAMTDARQQTFLLHGVTGSGKTQVYIEAIRSCLALGKGAIVLVPEISLTPQIVRRFNSHFPGSVAVLHSRLSPAERFDVWKRTLSSEYRVVIGPRCPLR
ncbi:MAG: DEAD/DEAH box helicase family protein, partial [Ignavibacteria bacterium]|nr:DEAD/DEAH box helicase family protein [Ignavibacteria bacterium]